MKGTDVKACPNCGRPSNRYDVAGRFLTGQDAPVGILTHALYEQLPALTPEAQDRLKGEYAHRFQGNGDAIVGGGRKLLIFSDSRQNAAFMASYLQDNTTGVLVREAAFDALRRHEGPPPGLAGWATLTVEEFARRGLRVPYLQECDLADSSRKPFVSSYLLDAIERKNRVLEYLLADVQGTQPLALEAVGLLECGPPAEALLGGADADPFELPPTWPTGPAARSPRGKSATCSIASSV